MKKIFFGLIVFALAACNNDSENESATDTTTNNNTSVENVNGNLPDTTNTIRIDGGTPDTAPPDTNRNLKDTSRK
jgi:hypothetical protein